MESSKKTKCKAYIIQIILLLAEVFLDFHRFDNKTWEELEIFYIFSSTCLKWSFKYKSRHSSFYILVAERNQCTYSFKATVRPRNLFINF